jgi:hypothetical protein
MSINEQGFLSPEMLHWIQKHRDENAKWFSLADDLNKIAHHLLPIINVPGEDNQRYVAALLFMRGLSNFQGALILAERGMTLEARVIVRGAFEGAFLLGAVLKAPEEVVPALISDEHSRKIKMARIWVARPDGFASGQVEKLQDYIDAQATEEAAELTIYKAAQLAGLTDIYDFYYRSLSHEAAHPSITALERYVQVNSTDQIVGFFWGPDVSDVENTIAYGFTAFIYFVAYATELFGRSAVAEALDRAWEQYKSLIELQKRPPL